MGIQIEDGTGSGKLARVDSENNLLVSSISYDINYHINLSNQKVWSIPFEGLNPAGANDYVIYIKNTGAATIHVDSISVMADTAATQIKVNHVSGTASSGSAIAPVNMTLGASPAPDATIQSDPDITGLTNEGTLLFIQCDTVNVAQEVDIGATIRLLQNTAIGILVETATANITGIITLVEEE